VPQTVAVAGATALVGSFGNDTVTPIDTRTLQPGAAVAVPVDPTGIAVTSAGTMAYISGGDSIVPVALPGLAVGSPIQLRSVAQALSLAPGDKEAWVALQTGSLVEVSLAAGTVGRTIHLGGHPSAVVIAGG